MAPTKLTPAARLILELIGRSGSSGLGRWTDDQANQVHAPATEALARRGLVEITSGAGCRRARLTEAGRKALAGDKPGTDLGEEPKTAEAAKEPQREGVPVSLPRYVRDLERARAAARAIEAAMAARSEALEAAEPAWNPASPRWQVGDVVWIRNRGHFVISSRRLISRGRRAGALDVELAPMKDARMTKDTHYGLTAKVSVGQYPHFAGRPQREWTADDVREALKSYNKHKQEVNSKRQAAKLSRRGALNEASPYPGDEVRIRYKGDVERWETVTKINRSTGKVGIRARGYRDDTRWIAATHVVEVRSPDKPLPFSLTLNEVDQIGELFAHPDPSKRHFVLTRRDPASGLLDYYIVGGTAKSVRRAGTPSVQDDQCVYCWNAHSFRLYWARCGTM